LQLATVVLFLGSILIGVSYSNVLTKKKPTASWIEPGAFAALRASDRPTGHNPILGLLMGWSAAFTAAQV
jgi:hypothetical protein